MDHKTITLRNRVFSYLIERRAVFWTFLLLPVLFTLLCISAGLGTLWIHPFEVARSLFGYGSDMAQTVLYSFRLPRAAMSMLAGACLAGSGALLQSVTRNPLASPDIIGITGGSAAAGVAFLVLTAGAIGIGWLSVASTFGAMLIALLLLALSWKGTLSPFRLILIGIALHTAAGALSTFLIIVSPYYLATQAFTWLTGSVYGNSWNNVLTLLPWAIGFSIAAWVLARRANVHELGEDVATAVGNRVSRDRTTLVLLSAALAGAAVSQVGAVMFIGLMAPHMARRLVGPSFGGVFAVSAIIGAILLLLADTIARTAFPPSDIPAGVFTAAIGAPFFIYLLLKKRTAG